MKTPLNVASLLAFMLLTSPLAAQTYEMTLVNRGPMYATASILLDFDNDEDLDILITRRSATTEPAPASVEWLENDGTGQFPRRELFQDLVVPVDIDAGDLDNDGDIDFVISDKGTGTEAGQLVWFQRQSDGSYIKWTIEAGISFDQADLADFDGDGNIDVVAVGFSFSTVSVYMNDGFLNFTKIVVADSVSQVDMIEADDIDEDGDADLLLGAGVTGFKLLFNNGEAIFDSSQTLYTLSDFNSSSNSGLAVADLNNDGRKDILTFSGSGSGGLYFLDGAQNFDQTLIERDGIDLGGDIVVADMNGDGLKDIIRQNFGDDYLSILYQDSPMQFRRVFLERNWDSKGPAQMSVGDLDGDGDLDLVFPENGNIDGDISWFEQIDGDLYRHYLYHEIQAVHKPRFGDVDADGDLDIVVSAGRPSPAGREDEIVWYENLGDNTFEEWRIDDDVAFPADLQLGDIDGDGSLDVVATATRANDLYWYKKNGPAWARFTIEENANLPAGCVLEDIDSDGDLDVAICSTGDNKVFWYENDGFGAFTRRVVDANLSEPQDIEALDADNDGDVDLVVVASDTNNTVSLYRNDGNESFARESLATGQSSYAVDIGNWDGANGQDIFVAFDKGSAAGAAIRDVAVFLNDGSGSFTDLTLIELAERTRNLKIFDADMDGDDDILLGAVTVFPVRLVINQGGAVESVTALTSNATTAYGFDAADINGDSIMDFVFSDQSNSQDNLWLFIAGDATGVAQPTDETNPNSFTILRNYPNPFNPQTTIRYELETAGQVSLVIYDIKGRTVRTLHDSQKPAGIHEVKWDGANDQGQTSPSGFYLVVLNTNRAKHGHRMLLIK